MNCTDSYMRSWAYIYAHYHNAGMCRESYHGRSGPLDICKAEVEPKGGTCYRFPAAERKCPYV